MLPRAAAAIVGVLALAGSSLLWAQDEFDNEPISYSATAADNTISQLQQRLEKGESRLAFEKHFGYLRSLLAALDVPQSSQMLVFSKTSFQRDRIAPRIPRSVFFNDDVYVGFCQGGDVLEISAVDPTLGAVFYSLDQQQVDVPRFVRHGDTCLLCHGSSQTQGVPGHLVRSVYSDAGGLPILSGGSFRIDQTSPIKNRWGGWYVSGTHGRQTHLGNLVIDGKTVPETLDNSAGQNVVDLSGRFNSSNYLTPYSDIVALMVVEHQVDAHNYLTRASFQTRQALHQEDALNRELSQPADYRWTSTTVRIRAAGEPLVKYFLFSGEAELTDEIRGTTSFAADFSARGPRDPQGRSLRDLDLRRRLFKYPCSYLIYSKSFDVLPGEVKDYVYRRMFEVLSGQDTSKEFAHLSADDRRAILEILLSTKSDLPDYWKPTSTAASN